MVLMFQQDLAGRGGQLLQDRQDPPWDLAGQVLLEALADLQGRAAQARLEVPAAQVVRAVPPRPALWAEMLVPPWDLPDRLGQPGQVFPPALLARNLQRRLVSTAWLS